MTASLRPLALLVSMAAVAWPLPAAAQTTDTREPPPGPWRHGLTIYGFFPTVGGKSAVPADTGGVPINVTAEQILDSIDVAAMASFDSHNGRWGVFADVVYIDMSASKQGTRDFTIGDIGLPANTTADIGFGLTGFVSTVAGQHRVAAEPAVTVDALGGVRYINIKQSLDWNISGSLGPLDPAARVGHSDIRLENWDLVAGVKGRTWLDRDRRWSLPFYVDLGTGETRFTWQVAAGLSYAFGWGELTGMWRYLGYDMKPGNAVSALSFHGPMLGATFRW